MSVKENKELMLRIWDKINGGEAAVIRIIDETCAVDFIFHSSRGETLNLEEFKKHNSDFFRAIPDAHFTVDDIIAEGDKVATRWTAMGTHTVAYRNIPATSKKLTFWGITIDRIANGKCVEEWERTDTLNQLQQLGLIPPLKSEK